MDMHLQFMQHLTHNHHPILAYAKQKAVVELLECINDISKKNHLQWTKDTPQLQQDLGLVH